MIPKKKTIKKKVAKKKVAKARVTHDPKLEEMKKEYFSLLLLENAKPNRKELSIRINKLEQQIRIKLHE